MAAPWGTFDDADLQALWKGYLGETVTKAKLSNAYLDKYYPNAP